MGEEPNLVVVAARLAYRVARLPFSWAAAAPVAAWSLLRGYKESFGEPGQAARAKFDTRKWTAELLKHLDWRRFEELCAAYFEALGFSTRITQSRAGGGVGIAPCAEGSAPASILVRCTGWDAYRIGVKPLRELRGAMTAA